MVCEKIVTLINEILGIDEDGLTMHTRFTCDLDMESIDFAKLIIAIEDDLRITIYDEDVSAFKTIGDLVTYCEARLHAY